MAVNNTLSVKEYKLTGAGLTTFPITFEFTTDGSGNAENIHCQFATKNDAGDYTVSEEISQGMATDQFQVDGGNVKYIDDAGNAGQNNYLVIYRSTPPSQLTDFIDNGNYSLEDIEKALDKLTFLIQERTGTPIGTYINVGVSLFFANFLQLLSKKDALQALFNWTDIDDADKPTLAGYIRSTLGAVSSSLSETIGGTKTFTLVPEIGQDPTSSTHATRKSYVDNYFPVATANIGDSQVTTAKIADGNITTAKIANSNVTTAKIADANVTTAKIADSNVTTAKIADSNITWSKLRKSSATVTMTYDDGGYYGTWSNGGNKILYGISGANARVYNTRANSGGLQYTFAANSSGNITVYYLY